MILEKYTDIAGKIRVVWQTNLGNSYLYKFDEDPSEDILQELGSKSDEQNRLLSLKPLALNIKDSSGVIADTIHRVRNASELMFGDYEAYIASLNWVAQSVVKAFMFDLVYALTENPNITEEESFGIAVDFVKSKSIDELSRLLDIQL